MGMPRYQCLACGVWTCSACGWRRKLASLAYEHACAKCPSRTGTLVPSMHIEAMWRQHNDRSRGSERAPLPPAYAWGERPAPPAEQTAPPGTGPEFYRGVRVPRTGPYSRLNAESFRQGVDACLARYSIEPETEQDHTP